MELTEHEHIWDKKADELTVADNLKISAGVMVVTMAIPVAVYGVIAAVNKVVTKVKVRKFAKDMNETLA